MDAVDRYFQELTALATELVAADRAADELLDRGADRFAYPELLALRLRFVSTGDRERVRGLLDTGCLAALTEAERIAAFVVCMELDDEVSKRDVVRRFEKYDRSRHLLLKERPALWSAVRKEELIASTHAKHLGRTGLVQVAGGGWGRLERYLPPELLSWAQTGFADAKMYIRLDPWFFAAEKPEEPLREAAVRPARPDWWHSLSLRNRESDGGHYVLQQPPSITDDITATQQWEYASRGVRSLEVYAERDKSGNLSMMIEELAQERASGHLIGRCIHLDTDAKPGTDASTSRLNHIDLAINVYLDGAATRRSSMKLSDGKVEDASVRTHLLRVENIPFSTSAEFARQFFHSTTLLREWMNDQFGEGWSPL